MVGAAFAPSLSLLDYTNYGPNRDAQLFECCCFLLTCVDFEISQNYPEQRMNVREIIITGLRNRSIPHLGLDGDTFAHCVDDRHKEYFMTISEMVTDRYTTTAWETAFTPSALVRRQTTTPATNLLNGAVETASKLGGPPESIAHMGSLGFLGGMDTYTWAMQVLPGWIGAWRGVCEAIRSNQRK